jgi:hypothetical protein
VTARVLYLITSHTNPDQVLRLVRTLRRGSPQAPIAIHHDRSKSELDPAMLRDADRVHLLPFSVPVRWGDFSIVEMNLRAFTWVLEHVEFDWLVLLSGMDYPIKPPRQIEAYLSATDVEGFLEEPRLVVPDAAAGGRRLIEYGPVFRYFYRYWTLPLFRGYGRLPGSVRRRLHRLRERLLPRLQNVVFLHPMPPGMNQRLGVRRLRTPFDRSFRCYKTSQWFTLSRRSVELVVRFAREHPRVVQYYRRTVIPDESFVQTVLLNHPGWRYVPDNMLFFKWGDVGSGSPDVLSVVDLEEILGSGKHFARKFDTRIDASVLDRLDERLFPSPDR